MLQFAQDKTSGSLRQSLVTLYSSFLAADLGNGTDVSSVASSFRRTTAIVGQLKGIGALNDSDNLLAFLVAKNTSVITQNMLGVNAEVEEDIQKLSDGICALTMTHRQDLPRTRTSSFALTVIHKRLKAKPCTLPDSLQHADHPGACSSILRFWFLQNLSYPFPMTSVKHRLATQASLTRQKVDTDLTNWRRRSGWTSLKDTYCEGSREIMRSLVKRFEAEDLMMGINASNPSHSRLFLNEHQQHGIGGEGGQEERWEDQEGEEGEERSVWREEKTDFNISDGDWEAFKAGVKKVRRYLERKEGEKVGEWVNEILAPSAEQKEPTTPPPKSATSKKRQGRKFKAKLPASTGTPKHSVTSTTTSTSTASFGLGLGSSCTTPLTTSRSTSGSSTNTTLSNVSSGTSSSNSTSSITTSSTTSASIYLSSLSSLSYTPTSSSTSPESTASIKTPSSLSSSGSAVSRFSANQFNFVPYSSSPDSPAWNVFRSQPVSVPVARRSGMSVGGVKRGRLGAAFGDDDEGEGSAKTRMKYRRQTEGSSAAADRQATWVEQRSVSNSSSSGSVGFSGGASQVPSQIRQHQTTTSKQDSIQKTEGHRNTRYTFPSSLAELAPAFHPGTSLPYSPSQVYTITPNFTGPSNQGDHFNPASSDQAQFHTQPESGPRSESRSSKSPQNNHDAGNIRTTTPIDDQILDHTVTESAQNLTWSTDPVLPTLPHVVNAIRENTTFQIPEGYQFIPPPPPSHSKLFWKGEGRL